MKRNILVILFIAFYGLNSFSQEIPNKQQVIDVITKVNDYWINGHTNPGNNKWARAAYFTGNMGLYKIYPDEKYLEYALNWAENNKWQLNGGIGTRHADNHCIGQTYIDLYEIDSVSEYLNDITKSIEAMVNSTKKDDWWWIDALYMAMPVFTRLGNIYNDTDYHSKLYDLYADTKFTRGLYNQDEGLWYRDGNFDPPYATPQGKHCYWARGNGWVIDAHVRTLEYLPKSDPHYDEYLNTFKKMSEALVDIQRNDGFWNASLVDSLDFGGPETSGTSFFTYALAWGINNNILDSATYYPVVASAWNGLSQMAVHDDGFLGYVQNVGKEPASSQPVTYESTADFGVGAFLLAGCEVYKLAQGEEVVPPVPPIPPVNLALNKLIDFSSQEEGNGATQAVDGSVTQRWSAENFPQWIEIDLQEAFLIDALEVVPYQNRAYQYTIELKANEGDDYEVIVDRSNNMEGGSSLLDSINPVEARFVKLNVSGCHNYTGDWISILEFRVLGDTIDVPVNNPPEIAEQSFTIDENSASGTVIGTVIATDDNNVLSYSIKGGNDNGAFSIDPESGELTVAKSEELDYETTPEFILLVEVSDDINEPVSATIGIQLNDLDETTGVNNHAKDSDYQLEVFPNPVDDVLYLQYNQAPKIGLSYSIHTISGKCILSGFDYSNSKGTQIDVSHLPSGVYIFSAHSLGENFTKIVIKK